ncbi:MAG: hypothetical protein BJ554DRAFT_7994, partial [Olpidium bornovanus]
LPAFPRRASGTPGAVGLLRERLRAPPLAFTPCPSLPGFLPFSGSPLFRVLLSAEGVTPARLARFETLYDEVDYSGDEEDDILRHILADNVVEDAPTFPLLGPPCAVVQETRVAGGEPQHPPAEITNKNAKEGCGTDDGPQHAANPEGASSKSEGGARKFGQGVELAGMVAFAKRLLFGIGGLSKVVVRARAVPEMAIAERIRLLRNWNFGATWIESVVDRPTSLQFAVAGEPSVAVEPGGQRKSFAPATRFMFMAQVRTRGRAGFLRRDRSYNANRRCHYATVSENGTATGATEGQQRAIGTLFNAPTAQWGSLASKGSQGSKCHRALASVPLTVIEDRRGAGGQADRTVTAAIVDLGVEAGGTPRCQVQTWSRTAPRDDPLLGFPSRADDRRDMKRREERLPVAACTIDLVRRTGANLEPVANERARRFEDPIVLGAPTQDRSAKQFTSQCYPDTRGVFPENRRRFPAPACAAPRRLAGTDPNVCTATVLRVPHLLSESGATAVLAEPVKNGAGVPLTARNTFPRPPILFLVETGSAIKKLIAKDAGPAEEGQVMKKPRITDRLGVREDIGPSRLRQREHWRSVSKEMNVSTPAAA